MHLAGIIVPAEDFPAGQLDPGTRPVNLFLQPDDGRTRQKLGDGVDVAATIQDHVSLAGEKQTDGPPCGTNVYWLKIGVEH